MAEQKLKSLALVQVNKQLKEEQWQNLQHKVQKKASFHWQVPAAIVASLAILFLFITITLNAPIETPNQAASERPAATIETVYASEFYLPKADPVSNFYPNVVKINDEAFLQQLNALLSEADWVEFEGEIPEDEYRYQFVYSNGASKYLVYESERETEYLIDRASGYAYVYTNTTDDHWMLYNALQTEQDSHFWKGYLFFLIILLLRALHDTLYKRKHKLERQPKMHTNHWQSVSTITIVVILILTTFFTEQVHFAWWVIGVGFNTFFCLKINKVEEHHAWRIRSILFNNATFIVYAVGLLYNLI